MIARDGVVKLMDFGLAFDLSPDASTLKDELCGTAGYLAPEQALNGPCDARTDIYTVGVVSIGSRA